MHPKDISISDYFYHLPTEKVAQYPADQRDKSKLIVYDGTIQTSVFSRLPDFISNDSFLLFNDTKVIQARFEFHKPSGARIEIFLLNPVSPYTDFDRALALKEPVVWNCLVGNRKKWKSDKLNLHGYVNGFEVNLGASYMEPQSDSHLIAFDWDCNNVSFGEIIEQFGKIPLPPYMTRPSENIDNQRYQTIFAQNSGSVAAPTAALHFTPQVMQSLNEKGVSHDFLTLNVGAGTFKPVTSDVMQNHIMHTETVTVRLSTLKILKKVVGEKKIVAVGTTTTRTLESLYWYANKLKFNPESDFIIQQWEPYDNPKANLSASEALDILIEYMERKNESILTGQTQLIIAPGYEFRFVDVLITNFHQPGSTLLLLVAAFIGESWREIYEYALKNDFRFLSYGDSCLFKKKPRAV